MRGLRTIRDVERSCSSLLKGNRAALPVPIGVYISPVSEFVAKDASCGRLFRAYCGRTWRGMAQRAASPVSISFSRRAFHVDAEAVSLLRSSGFLCVPFSIRGQLAFADGEEGEVIEVPSITSCSLVGSPIKGVRLRDLLTPDPDPPDFVVQKAPPPRAYGHKKRGKR